MILLMLLTVGISRKERSGEGPWEEWRGGFLRSGVRRKALIRTGILDR